MSSAEDELSALYVVALGAVQQGNFQRATECEQRAQELLRVTQDQQADAAFLCVRAYIEYERGAYREARRSLLESIKIEAGDSPCKRRATSTAQLGVWASEHGDADAACMYLEQGLAELELLRPLDVELELAQFQIELGMLRVRNMPSVCVRMVRQAVVVLEVLGHRSALLKRQHLGKIGADAYRVARTARTLARKRDQADLAYEEGALALLIDRPNAAVEPLRVALFAYRKSTPSRQVKREAQAAWALSKALSFCKDGHVNKQDELNLFARSVAATGNMNLPWFPEKGASTEEQRYELQRQLYQLTESTSFQWGGAIKQLALSLVKLPDTPETKAELLVKGAFHTGGVDFARQLGKGLEASLAESPCESGLAEAISQELCKMTGALAR